MVKPQHDRTCQYINADDDCGYRMWCNRNFGPATCTWQHGDSSRKLHRYIGELTESYSPGCETRRQGFKRRQSERVLCRSPYFAVFVRGNGDHQVMRREVTFARGTWRNVSPSFSPETLNIVTGQPRQNVTITLMRSNGICKPDLRPQQHCGGTSFRAHLSALLSHEH